jgi:hypothetical protein
VSWVKPSMMGPSDAEVASAKLVKRIKNIALGSSAAPSLAQVSTGTPSAKGSARGVKKAVAHASGDFFGGVTRVIAS